MKDNHDTVTDQNDEALRLEREVQQMRLATRVVEWITRILVVFLLAFLVAATVSMAGCAGMDDRTQRVVSGAAIGGAIGYWPGAAVGAGVGYLVDLGSGTQEGAK